MADADAFAVKERLHKGFSDIAAYQKLLGSCNAEWKDLDSFISKISSALKHKVDQLSAKEKDFEEKNSRAVEALAIRRESIPAREEAALSKLQEQQEEALSSLEKEKQKVTNINASREMVDDDEDDDDDDASIEEGGEHDHEDEFEEKPVSGEVRVRPQLKFLCETMDGDGLRMFAIKHRKEPLRDEIIMALQSAIDPARLVLTALQGYDLNTYNPKDPGAPANRRACVLLLECLALVVADPVLGVGHPLVSPNIREDAKRMADLWKANRDLHADVGIDNSVDAHAFLQLLATFGLGLEFDSDDLLKLVTGGVARRKQAPALCESLGLTDKMPGFVESLIKEGKQMQALCFAHHFRLMDKVQPGSLIRSYLKEARRVAEELNKNAPTRAAGKNDSLIKELSSVKAVLKAIKDFNLAEHYPTDGLIKRLEQLEKERNEMKMAMGGIGAGGGRARLGDRSYRMRPKRPRFGTPHGYDRHSRNYGSLYGGYPMAGSSIYPAAPGYTNMAGGYGGYH